MQNKIEGNLISKEIFNIKYMSIKIFHGRIALAIVEN